MVAIVIEGILIDLVSTKITWQTETQIQPFTETEFKKSPFVLKLKLQENTKVTLCHSLPSTCCPTVVSCQGAFHSLSRNLPKSFHSRTEKTVDMFSLEQFPRLKMRHFVLLYQPDHYSVWHSLCLFSVMSIPGSFSSFFTHPQGLDWKHRLCFSITLLYIYTVTHRPPVGAS